MGSFVGGGNGGCGFCAVSWISCGRTVWVWDRTWFEGGQGHCEGDWRLCGVLSVGSFFGGSSFTGGGR